MKHKKKEDKKKKGQWASLMVIIGVALLLVGAMVILHSTQIQPQQYQEITTEDGIPPYSQLIDVRPYPDYNHSSIGGSINVPYSCTSCFENSISNLNKSARYVIYGFNAIPATIDMADSGFTDLYVLTDWQRWIQP